jgi:hypothetical protein
VGTKEEKKNKGYESKRRAAMEVNGEGKRREVV